MAEAYSIGDKVRLTGTLTDVSSNELDPSGGVVVRVKSPAGTITTPSVTNSATGVYYSDISVTSAGTWYYRFEATGNGQAAAEESFSVERSEF